MKLPRRQFLHLAAGAAALPASPRIAKAQAYPLRPVRFIVPFPPGGSADPIARVLANRLSEIWGQQAVIENKGGAGGNLGAQTAAAAAPDGYNIFLGGAFMAKNPFLYPGSGYDPVTDLAPVAKVCEFSNIMVVPNSSPVKSVREFIDHPPQPLDDLVHLREIGGEERDEAPVRWHVGYETGIDGIVAKLIVLDQMPDHVNPKAVDTLAQPKAHDFVHGARDLGIAPVEIGLLQQERVIIILT